MLSTTVTGDARIDVEVDGRIEGDGLAALRRTVEEEAARHGPVRLLVTVRHLGVVSMGALREDLKSVGLVKLIDRYAVVTDVGWLRTAAYAEFRLLPIDGRAFAGREEAVAWLEADRSGVDAAGG